jgi:hypothetical protein
VQAETPATPAVPAGQTAHAAPDRAPKKGKDDPAAHLEQTDIPSAEAHEPGRHAVQRDPCAETVPARQLTQAEALVDPAGELVPLGHMVQLLAPDNEKVPAAQSAHIGVATGLGVENVPKIGLQVVVTLLKVAKEPALQL